MSGDYTKLRNLSYIMRLTCAMGGVQMIWALVFSNGTIHLISLGISKSVTALAWASAPICGVIVQPLVGAASDNTHSRIGQRRPFIIIGAFGTIFSVLALAWVESIIHALQRYLSFWHQSSSQSAIPICTIAIVCLLSIAIQPVQMGLRAVIVEYCHPKDQSRANLWASYWICLGNIIGYGSNVLQFSNSASASVSKLMSRFQILCLIAVLVFITTVSVTCLSLHERHSRSSQSEGPVGCGSVKRLTINLYKTYSRSNAKTRGVFAIQVWAWMAWFPYLYYGSTYVSELSVSNYSDGNTVSRNQILQNSARLGSLGFLLLATVSLFISIALPRALRMVRDSQNQAEDRAIAIVWTSSLFLLFVCSVATFFIKSWSLAVVLMAYLGIPWSLTQFAPFLLIGKESLQMEEVGSIMGLHNVSISLPQLLSALFCALVFSVLKHINVAHDTAWLIRATIFPAAMALWRSSQLVTMYNR